MSTPQNTGAAEPRKMSALTDHEIENGSLADLAKQAGYASLRSMLNDLRMWGATEVEAEEFLREQIVAAADSAQQSAT